MLQNLICRTLVRNYSSSNFLDGKVALVTGGAVGIGYSICKELLKNGAKVCVADISEKKLEKAMKKFKVYGDDRTLYCTVDVSKYDQMDCIFLKACIQFKKLDIVINNAGILDDHNWQREIDVNIRGLVKGSRLAFQYMSKEKGHNGGDLINMSSILGVSLVPGCPVYVGSKHFALGYSRCLALPQNYDKSCIRVMMMCPGVTTTPMIKNADKIDAPEKYLKAIRKDIASNPAQPVKYVSKGIIHMLKCGENGSIWVSEDCKPIYEIEHPGHTGFRMKKKC